MNKTFGRWFVANVAGMVLALGTHPFIAHGFTGQHGNSMTPAQWVAHIISFTLAGAIIFGFQRAGAAELFNAGVFPAFRAGVLATIAFLGVWATAGIPFDILASFLAFGLSLGLALRNRSKRAVFALVGTTGLAGVTTVAAGIPIAGKLMSAAGGGIAGDAALWIYIGVTGGVLSGLFGSVVVRRMLATESQRMTKAAGNFA